MPALGDAPLASKPLCVKLPADIYAVVEPLENRSEWLRRVICEAAQKELMPPTESGQSAEQEQAIAPKTKPTNPRLD